eukprot:3058350-Amphidinium_carterae.1
MTVAAQKCARFRPGCFVVAIPRQHGFESVLAKRRRRLQAVLHCLHETAMCWGTTQRKPHIYNPLLPQTFWLSQTGTSFQQLGAGNLH